MTILYVLLGIIAIGTLLASENGMRLLMFFLSCLKWLMIGATTVLLGLLIYSEREILNILEIILLLTACLLPIFFVIKSLRKKYGGWKGLFKFKLR